VDTKVSKNSDTIQLLAVFEDAGAVVFELDANYSKNQANGVNLVKLELNITSAHAILAGSFGNVGNREDSGVGALAQHVRRDRLSSLVDGVREQRRDRSLRSRRLIWCDNQKLNTM